MKISVITTSLNHGRFLGETLESVRLQGYIDLEHLVIDGGSTDGTRTLLESKHGEDWQHLRWISEPDNGQSHAMNKGFCMATGDVIGWLNSDDRYCAGCLQTVAQAFEQNPEIDVIYGDYTFMDEQGRHMRVRREIAFNRLVLFYHYSPYIPTTSTFFRRRIFDEGNLLDESLHYAMDQDFYVRLATKNYRFKHISTVLADFRLHSASKTCATAKKQLAESRMTMYRRAPAALRLKSQVIREVCIAILQFAAAVTRWSEKLLRGYYLRDLFAGLKRMVL